WTALSNLPFCCGSGARAARGSFRAYRRYLSPLAVELQLLSRGLGWLHRAVWHGGANRCRDGDLSERSGGTKTGTGRRNDTRNFKGSSNRRRTAPSAAKGHDSVNRGCRIASHYVEHERGRRSNEAFGNAGARRHGFESAARPDRDP